MTSTVVIAAAIHLLAIVWSVRLLARNPSWRLAFLPLFIGLITIEGLASTYWLNQTSMGWTGVLGASAAIGTGLLAFLSVFLLERLLTELNRTVRARDASERRYRALVQGAPLGIVAADSAGAVLTVNQRLADLVGAPSVDAAFRVPLGAWGREGAGALLDAIRDGAGLEGAGTVETAFLSRWGKAVELRLHVSPLRDSAGAVRGTQAIVEDLHEVRAAEALLRASEARFRALADGAPAGVFQSDADGHLLYVNERCCEIFGSPADDLLGLGWQAFVHPADRGAIVQSWLAQAARGGMVSVEMRYVRAGGGEGWAIAQAAPLLEDEEPAGHVGMLLDITQRKQTERELALLAIAIEQAAESVVITDTQGRIEYVNPAYTRNTGYSRAESLGRAPGILHGGEEAPEFYRDLWATLQRGEVWRGRFRNRRKDDSIYYEDAVIFGVRDETGTIVRYVSLQHDVTERLRLEAQLRQAQKLEAVGTLAGGIAHDFNNLLTAILGGLGFALQDLPEHAAVRPDLVQAEEAALRCAELTRQLLALSRRQEPRLAPMNVNAVADRVARLLQRSVPETIHVRTRFDAAVPRIMGDESQIEQMLLNLGINARDAMPAGGELAIETRLLQPDQLDPDHPGHAFPGACVRLTVRDTGVGMPPDVQERIFEPFFTTKEQGKGTGLGLAMVYSSVQAHGGDIAVESTPGTGTRFSICLPAVEAQQEPAPVPTDARPYRGSETVLLVDDADPVLFTGRGILARCGYTVLIAHDGLEALEVLERPGTRVDLIVTDLVMPRRGGRDLLRDLRRRGIALPVVLTSGHTAEHEPQELLAEGFAAFVPKPLDPGVLARTVREVLDHAPA